MVIIKFKTERDKINAWQRAGEKVGKYFYPKGFKGKWVGKNSISFPNYNRNQLKRLMIIK